MSSGASKRAQTVIASLAKAGALSLLALVLAYWTWAWCAPAVLPRAMEVSAPTTRLAAAGKLFGQLQSATHADAPSGLAIQLLGVMAAQPAGSGYALLRLDAGKTRFVRAGGYLAPGIRLEQVLPQQVVLQRNGVRETLVWPQPAKTSSAAPSAPVR